MSTSTNSNTPKIIGAVAISAVVAVGVFVFLHPAIEQQTNTGNQSASVSTQQATSTNSTDLSSPASTGTTTINSTPSTNTAAKQYSETVTYRVPHETNTISVNVSLQNGTITAVSATHEYADHESSSYINSFNSSVRSAVVGKQISNISPSRIGGASLTSEAFYEALQSIARQAS